MALDDFIDDDSSGKSIETEELLDDIRVAYCKTDGYLTTDDYNDIGSYSHSAASERFGSWYEALEKAGAIHKHSREATKGDFQDDILRLTASLGRVPKVREYYDRGFYSFEIMKERFGKWSEVKSEINDEISDLVRSMMIRDVKDFANSTDKNITLDNYETYSQYTQHRIRKHFDSWTKLLTLADLEEVKKRKQYDGSTLTETEKRAVAFMLVSGYSYEDIKKEFELDVLRANPDRYVDSIKKEYITQEVIEILNAQNTTPYDDDDRSIEWVSKESKHDVDEVLSDFSEALRDLEKFGDTRLLITLCINLVSDHTT